MQNRKMVFGRLGVLCVLVLSGRFVNAQEKAAPSTAQVTDGVDRLRGEKPTPSQLGPSFGPVYHSMPSISVDANSASEISQRYNVIVNSLYSPGLGRPGRSSWDLQIGLSGLSKIDQETGGECYSVGTSNLVSFKPYLEQFQKALDNQYYLVFLAVPKKSAGSQRFAACKDRNRGL